MSWAPVVIASWGFEDLPNAGSSIGLNFQREFNQRYSTKTNCVKTLEQNWTWGGQNLQGFITISQLSHDLFEKFPVKNLV